MRIITLHSDSIEIEPRTKAIKDAEEIKKGKMKFGESLVILTGVEKADESDIKKTAVNAADAIEKVANDVKCRNIVLYPYVHLISSPASPGAAKDVIAEVEKVLKSRKFEVSHAPFGWYKQFTISVKGHPLAELSRSIYASGKAPEMKIQAIEPEKDYDPKKLLRDVAKPHLDKEKLKENDHRILGQQLDLFSFNDMAPGMVFWHNNGLVVYNELIKYWREEHAKRNYQEISTPQMLDKRLWQISGHWEKYKENNFSTEYDGRPFLIKPMNCPGGILVYRSKPHSYKELPLRMAELGIVHRQELSGVLSGLFRVIRITQDDAHIYCTEDQLEDELIGVINLIHTFYTKFGFEYRTELSTRPEKRIGDEKMWDRAEKILESVLKKKKLEYKLNPGDGAFYGPKIDFHIKDSLGRSWQCATLQLDFSMPERFELEYVDNDNKMKRPVMLHRTVFGSLERFIGVLLEHTNGNLPVWLSPIQARVLSFTDRNIKAAEKIHRLLKDAGIRADIDIASSTVNEKVRNAELMKIPYIIVIGDKEEEKDTIAVRARGKKVQFGVKPEKFLEELKAEISERK